MIMLSNVTVPRFDATFRSNTLRSVMIISVPHCSIFVPCSVNAVFRSVPGVPFSLRFVPFRHVPCFS